MSDDLRDILDVLHGRADTTLELLDQVQFVTPSDMKLGLVSRSIQQSLHLVHNTPELNTLAIFPTQVPWGTRLYDVTALLQCRPNTSALKPANFRNIQFWNRMVDSLVTICHERAQGCRDLDIEMEEILASQDDEEDEWEHAMLNE